MPEQTEHVAGHNPIVVGITGGPGSGKSYVARILAALGAQTADADLLVRWCYNDPEFRREIAERFGPDVLDADGGVDRTALAGIVFADENALADLEGIVHPAVLHQMADLVEAYRHDPERAPMLALEIPLLYETGAETMMDHVLVVRARPEEIHRRLRERGWTDERIAAVDRSQMPPDEKAGRADSVIDTDGTPEQTTELAERFFERLTETGP